VCVETTLLKTAGDICELFLNLLVESWVQFSATCQPYIGTMIDTYYIYLKYF